MYKGKSEVFIVAGGPSLKGFDFKSLQSKITITINKSIFHVPNPNYFITVDYSFLEKIGQVYVRELKQMDTTKIFVADMHYDYMVEDERGIRDIRKRKRSYNLSLFDVVIKSYEPKGFGYTFNDFRTGFNTGYCALQLAISLGFQKIYLLGMDMCKDGEQTHYHRGYTIGGVSGAKLNKFYECFKMGLKQIKSDDNDIQIFSCSNRSRLNGLIPYIDIEKALED